MLFEKKPKDNHQYPPQNDQQNYQYLFSICSIGYFDYKAIIY